MGPAPGGRLVFPVPIAPIASASPFRASFVSSPSFVFSLLSPSLSRIFLAPFLSSVARIRQITNRVKIFAQGARHQNFDLKMGQARTLISRSITSSSSSISSPQPAIKLGGHSLERSPDSILT
jgi:hypothetical protein